MQLYMSCALIRSCWRCVPCAKAKKSNRKDAACNLPLMRLTRPVHIPALKVKDGYIRNRVVHLQYKGVALVDDVLILDVMGSCEVVLGAVDRGRQSAFLAVEIHVNLDIVCSILPPL